MRSIFSQKRKFGWADGVVVILICLILFTVINSVVRFASSRALGVVEAEYQSFTDSVQAEALVIRGEHLISAPAAGYFRAYYEEGTKVAAGSPIGAMTDDPSGEDGSQVNSGAYSGTVSYRLDGWEDILNAEALDSTDRAALIKLYTDGSVENKADNSTDSTASGRTVAKIIDNFQGYHVLLWLDEPPHRFVDDGIVNFTYETKKGVSEPVEAEVEENGMLEDGRYYLLLNVAATVTDMAEMRHLNCTLLGETVSGIMLPEEAVVLDDEGQAGVWTVNGNILEFRPVNITGRHEGAYLTDDLNENTLIVTAPEKAREGAKYQG